ncbi:receptor-like protein 11 [Camellia sinensis]|uniref:receptor-like protein 11 n=1 Tax=Camellia sinensis TaxID=4442 RepID=UPI001035A4E6|nr:receptor-like protein 11 [Camellia sinensis]
MKGPLLIPPLSIQSYLVTYNELTRELPPLICQLRSPYTLDLSNNNLTGTISPCLSNLSDSLLVLDLKDNNFQGPIPHSYKKGNKLKMIDFSGNKLQGKVPRSLVSCTELGILDLSHNLTEDTFPFWLGDLTKLQVLILRSNKFYGAIESPKIKLGFPNLRIIDLSHNGFIGNLLAKYFQNLIARSLASCTELGILDLSHDLTEDTFPFWLGDITKLQVLILRSNKFYGAIESPKIKLEFPNLRIIDLSHNGFIGNLLAKYFQNLIAMKFFDVNKATYMYAPIEIPLNISLPWISIYYFNMNITNKGVNTDYKWILNIFTAIDLSRNKFEGEIPKFFGNLKGFKFSTVPTMTLVVESHHAWET